MKTLRKALVHVVPARLVLALPFLLTACGYQMVHTNRVLGQTSIAIAPILEPSVVGISSLLTQEFEQRLLFHGLQVVPDNGSAPLRLVVTLRNPRTTATAISSVDKGVPTYREIITMDAKLVDTATGQSKWNTRLTSEEMFRQETTADSTLLTDAGRIRALHRLATHFAVELCDRIFLASVQRGTEK